MDELTDPNLYIDMDIKAICILVCKCMLKVK